MGLKREGFKFIAWTPDLVTGLPEYEIASTVTIGDRNVVLYAKWEEKNDPKKLAGLWKVTTKNDVAASGWFAFNGSKYGYWLGNPGTNPVPTIEYIANKGLLNGNTGNVLLNYVMDQDTLLDKDILIVIINENGRDVRYRCERDINLVWTFNPNASGATIIAYNPLRDLTEKPIIPNSLHIPAQVLGLDVTAIGARAFFQTPLVEVVFDGSTVTSIGDDAFAYCGLSTITIPNAVTLIGARAFRANKLINIIIPSSIKDFIIESGDKDTNPPTGILATTLPDGAQFFPGIGANAFADSTLPLTFDTSRNPTSTLAILDLGASPGPFSIGESAFARAGLSGTLGSPGILTIPAGVRDNETAGVPGIGVNAFDALKSGDDNSRNFLKEIIFATGSELKTIGNGAFRNNQISIITNVPASLTKIGVILPGTQIGAFEGNAFAGDFAIPNSVEEIGPNAFKSNKIAGLILGSNVKIIGEGAFSENSLSSLTVPSLIIPPSVKLIGKRAFANSILSGLVFASGVGELIIDDEAFTGNRIASLTIPAGVTKLGKGAFRNNSFYLTAIDLSAASGITEIPALAFGASTALEYVFIPNGVVSIGESAFYGCTKLKEIDIPASVTKIGQYAFFNAPLTTIIKRSGTITIFKTAANSTIETLSDNTSLEQAFGNYGAGKDSGPKLSATYIKIQSGTYTFKEDEGTPRRWIWDYSSALPPIPY
ncbi:leucine-rich repeat domain-containing protein [Treponema primitia]|uniref:leucine-rich repeat domain-containing protein n=1 Tax=Treponema primitia TaxID=88058 RepID=UPI002FCD44AA